MALVGIDFGTTNTVAVIHDRGVFSVVLHRADTGAGTIVQDIFPSAILIDNLSGKRWFGLEADRRFGQRGPGPNYVFLPSLKRDLRHYAEGRSISGSQATGVKACDGASDADRFDIAELFTAFLQSLSGSIRESGMIEPAEPLQAVVTWPANANGAQRHITRKCFRDAGFEVLSTLNEPTASAIELADCLTAGRGARKDSREPAAVAVFDLGGGTFDASVVWVDGDDFEVLASGGIEDLGGDDFDRALLDMFLEKFKLQPEALSPLTRHALLRQARAQKETIAGGMVRSLFLNPTDFGLDCPPVSMPVDAYFERITPMLKPAVAMLRKVIASAAAKEPRIRPGPGLTLYLVGGSARLPLVARMVSDAFPHCRVILTDKPFTSVAMGAAICATDRVSYRDVFARHFGLLRLKDHGQSEVFDIIFPAGTPIPRRGEQPLERLAWYHPRHSVGHLRYLECTSVGINGLPDGSVRYWSDVFFPYDPALPMDSRLSAEDIVSTDRFSGTAVCESYRCDSDGVITVELRRPTRNDARTHEIYHD
jgi:molecular chaperone DnaK